LCSVKECMIRVVRRNRLLLGMKDNISKFDSAYRICASAIEYERVIGVSGEPVARVASIEKSNSNVPRYLKRRCTMNASSRGSEASFR
jgi:hypothetical protein